MRLFVAAPLDSATREAVAGAIDRVRRLPVFRTASVRWIEPGNLHLTLQFLGETSPETAAAVVEALGAAAGRPPFRAALGPAGLFPAHGPPRVLWLGIGAGGAELAALREAVGRRLSPLGWRPDGRPYRAHLTIGRLRPARPAARRAPARKSSPAAPIAVQPTLPEVRAVERRRLLEAGLGAIAPPAAAWVVDRVVLMESRLSSAGAAYRVVSEVRLGGAPQRVG